MITQFHIRNFRSIVDLHLDFTYGEGKAPNGYKEDSRLPFIEVETPRKQLKRAVPVFAFYGRNAGGKSSIIKAFEVLQNLLRGGLQGCYEPNRLHRELGEGTSFDLEWVMGDGSAELGYHLYRYSITYTNQRVLSEELKLDGTTLFHAFEGHMGEETLSSKDNQIYTKEKVAEIYRTTCTDGKGRQVRPVFSTFSQQFPGLNFHLRFACSTIGCLLVLNDLSRLPYLVDTSVMQGSFFEDEHVEKVGRMMRGLDIDIERVYIRREKLMLTNSVTGEPETKDIAQIYVEHRLEDGSIETFRLQDESRGTQILLMLYCVMEGVSIPHAVFIIDELDNSIHPLLLRELVERFTKRERNRTECQLIFTAHNSDLLDGQHLRISEVGIVDKTRRKGTMVDRLCELDGVRNVDNFRKDYLAGEYAGTPFVAYVELEP